MFVLMIICLAVNLLFTIPTAIRIGSPLLTFLGIGAAAFCAYAAYINY